MIKDVDKVQQLPPALVRPGDRLKAQTINRLIESVGSPRTLRENPMPFKGKVGGFSGTAYVSGRKLDGLNSNGAKPWVKINLSTLTATEEAGPAPNPFEPDEEWYEKANTYGDIHLPRL